MPRALPPKMLDQHAERPEQDAGGDMLVQRPAVPFLPLRPGSSPANAVRTRYPSASSRGGANALRNQSEASFIAAPALSTTPTQNMNPWLTPR